ncbi:hypothetical protein, partial [Aminobacter carboxidus]
MNQHHVGSPALTTDRSMHPGVISDEGGSHYRTDQKEQVHNRTLAADLPCAKPLDWDGLVTEVLTL